MSEINTQSLETAAQINYGLLAVPATKQEVDAYRKRIQYRPGSRKRLTQSSLVIGAITMGIQLLLLMIDPNSYSQTPGSDFEWKLLLALGSGVAMVGFLNAVGFAIELDLLRRHRTMARMYRFAEHNQIELIDGDIGVLSGSLLSGAGHSEAIDMGYRLPSGIEMGNYEYSVGHGKYETRFKWGFVKIPLTRRLPHLLLDSRRNNLTKSMTNLPARYQLSQQFELEGDFNKYFSVYVPSNYQTDTLYVLTPDVMAALIDHAKEFDVEVIGDCVYLYAERQFKLDNPNKIQSLVAVAETIARQLTKQSRHYVDARVNGGRATNVIARPGKRLKKRKKLPILLVMCIVLVIEFFSFLLTLSVTIGVVFFLTAGVTIVTGIVFGALRLARVIRANR